MKKLFIILSVISLIFFSLTLSHVMAAEKVGPSMAVTTDGKVLFFDKNGNEIKAGKKMSPKELIEFINKNDNLRSAQTISFYTFGDKSECKIIIVTRYGTWCFWVDCNTNAIIRSCR
jgi:hypothetical protein